MIVAWKQLYRRFWQILACLKEIHDNLPRAWLTLQLGTQSVGSALSKRRCVRKWFAKGGYKLHLAERSYLAHCYVVTRAGRRALLAHQRAGMTPDGWCATMVPKKGAWIERDEGLAGATPLWQQVCMHMCECVRIQIHATQTNQLQTRLGMLRSWCDTLLKSNSWIPKMTPSLERRYIFLGPSNHHSCYVRFRGCNYRVIFNHY